jgi:creatinine amidohydrolase
MTRGAEHTFVAEMTSDELATAARGDARLCILVPVGAIEPHGPHLPLDTDLIISRAAAARAVPLLRAEGLRALVAPDVPYGVTECARDFCGAVSVPAPGVESYLRGVVSGWLRAGAAHVCLVNNHLEPANDAAVRAAVVGFEAGRASAATPLERRFGRMLSDEFKRGACHAGEYETSIVMAASPESVRDVVRRQLPEVDISLSENLARGVERFGEMGLTRAYAGAPARASAAHGEEMLARLAEMVATTVRESVALLAD